MLTCAASVAKIFLCESLPKLGVRGMTPQKLLPVNCSKPRHRDLHAVAVECRLNCSKPRHWDLHAVAVECIDYTAVNPDTGTCTLWLWSV